MTWPAGAQVPPETRQDGSPPAETDTFEASHKDKSYIFLRHDVAITLNDDWSYTTKTYNKVKILKEDAKGMGEIPIPYLNGRETVTDVEAGTITPDGKRHGYSRIQDINEQEGYGMYSDAMVKVITLPKVNVGSVLEYRTAVQTRGKPFKDAFWFTCDFDLGAPAKEENLTITFPKNFQLRFKDFNLKCKPTVSEGASTITYSWRAEDVYEDERAEEFVPPPSPDSVKNLLEISSIQSWVDISDWYGSLVQKNLKITPQIEEAAAEILEGRLGARDKAKAVLEYMQDNFRYVSMAFGDKALEPHPTDEVFHNGYGDCKDLSLLCMALLKAGGVDSNMALFSGEFAAMDPQYDLPIPSLFDHVLLLVHDEKGGDFYIDPILKGYDIGQFPSGYQAGYVFIITTDGGRFDRFPVFDEADNLLRIKQTVTIAEDGSALVEGESAWPLEFSVASRMIFRTMDEKLRERFLQGLETQITSGGEMLEHRFEGIEDRCGPITSHYKFKRPDYTAVLDDMMIIAVGGEERGGEFTEKTRENPIFYPENSTEERVITLHLPKSFRVSYLPKDVELDIGFFRLEKRYEKKGDALTVTEIGRYKRSPSPLPKEEYERVKKFFDELPRKTKQYVVLKKKKGLWQSLKEAASKD